MNQLDAEILAYEKMLPSLEAQHFGKWVVIRDGALACVHANFEDAADEAVRNFGRGPYLIRQVGAQMMVPAAIVSRPLHDTR